jgi:hypothetical protein
MKHEMFRRSGGKEKIITVKSGNDFVKKAVMGHVSLLHVTPCSESKIRGAKNQGKIQNSKFFTLMEGKTSKGDWLNFKKVNAKSSMVLKEGEIKPDKKKSDEELINLSKTIGYRSILKGELPNAVIQMQGSADIEKDKYPEIVNYAKNRGIIFPSIARFK